MKLLKYISFVLFLLPLKVYASHIVGGEMYYDCLGNNQYRVTIKIYRDCNSNGAEYDNPLLLGVFKKEDYSRVKTETISYPGSEILPVIFSNPCVSPPSDICVQEAIYTKTITLPPLEEGYILTYERCCRGPDIVNLYNPGNQGLTLLTEIPGTNSGISCNSSPRFTNYPPLLLCNNEPLIFDHSATDPDGDELVYELSTPLHGGSTFDPKPNPPNNPPMNYIVWENGFSETVPFGPSGSISINPSTGELIAAPDLIGKFVVGVTVKEYRNGVLIGQTQRDFLFTVFNCEIDIRAEIIPQENLPNYESVCDGLTINFENNSTPGKNYLWDFGVPGTSTDTSTDENPTFTFPEEGVYTVTLTVNPGWSCAETTTQEFEVYESISSFFDQPDGQCFNGNSFDFQGEGDYKSDATFLWEFGQNANPTTGTNETMNNIVYDTTGAFPVNYTVFWKDCKDTYTDTAIVFKEPKINFGVSNEIFCQNQAVNFIDSSFAQTKIYYKWDFGDGNTSTAQNPVHYYENIGVYDIDLTITTKRGCERTLNMSKTALIEVYPSPIADFSISPQELTIFNSEVEIIDNSIDSDLHYYQLTPEADTTQRNLKYHFIEGGYHYPYQVVSNSYGCIDTAIREIYLEPYTTIYVPNAFTPDQRKYNEVFKPVVYDVTDYTFEVYNRWGQKIFSTHNTKEGWDGTYKNKIAKDGIYVYRIRYTNHLGIGEKHHGHFSLLK
ncbi:hypothetical protein CW751_01950 [Brumimicrobium salinarum]|uniref:PKD domain-containing protein n=1 Tax=Brumimicrobium salinarum TaxID=2058658 RepID=A0A2I0R6B3_9FLAO|nr:PKD domain-containing protein [Brumimicrobium salinarum]PKR82124.1 hypothetical protein CW751_01950 [Brumimicrobium salinarum]